MRGHARICIVYMRVHAHICIFACMYICVYANICVCIFACMYVCLYANTCVILVDKSLFAAFSGVGLCLNMTAFCITAYGRLVPLALIHGRSMAICRCFIHISWTYIFVFFKEFALAVNTNSNSELFANMVHANSTFTSCWTRSIRISTVYQ